MTIAEQRKIAADLESAKPVPSWDTVDDLSDVRVEFKGIDGKKKSLNFEKAVEYYEQIDRQIAQLEAIKKEIKEPIQAGLLVAGVEKVSAAGCSVQIVNKEGSKRVDPQKLMELGVEPMLIAKATVVGKSTQYVMIRAAKEKEY